jgi:uncharacterized protein
MSALIHISEPARRISRWPLWLGLALLWLCTAAWGQVEVPPLTARVTDLTATLDAGQSAELEARLQQFEAEKGSQISVLIVPTTQPEAIEQYSMRVVEAWKLGRAKVDDGLLLLVAKEDRAVRIEVGYGLEGAVSDIQSKRIIEEDIVPRFRNGDFHGGIDMAVTRLIGLLQGEALPEPDAGSGAMSLLDDYLPMVMLFAIVGGGLFRAIFGRLLGASLISGIGFVGAWWLVGAVGAALIFAIFVFLLTLLSGSGGSGGGGGSSGGGGWSSGGGGYSGGGGSFGGGGASGSW